MGEHALADWNPKYVQLGTGLAGGLAGSRQEMCGALSGGVLLIGGLLGRQYPDEDDAQAYELAAQYRERFLIELGDTQCAPLREAVEAPGGPGTCAPLVERATAVLLGLLALDGRDG